MNHTQVLEWKESVIVFLGLEVTTKNDGKTEALGGKPSNCK